MSALVWGARLAVVLPALAALVGGQVPRNARGVSAGLGVAGAAGALLAAVAELAATSAGRSATGIAFLGPVPTGAGRVVLDLRADQLSAVVAVMVAVVALCVQVYSVSYQGDDPRYRAYAWTVSLFTAAMLLVVQSDDLLLLLIGWEVMGLCSYLLVGHDSQREAARRAAVKAFLVTRVGDIGFVLGVVVLLAAVGTTSISTLLDPQTLRGLGTGTATAASLLLIAGVVGKSAQFPLHTWLPDAMEGPTPISALIHAATMVAAGGFVLARLLPLLVEAPAARATLAALTALTMLGSALVACAQSDLKRVLAWSTISQVAYVLAALAIAPEDLGAAPSVVQLLSHAGFKALLFLSAGALAHQVHTTALEGLSGAGRRSPWVAVALTLGLASLAGVPPLSGFWSKEAVLGAAEETALSGGPLAVAGWVVLVAGLLTVLVTAVYATRTWLLVVPAAAATDDAEAELVADDSPTRGDAPSPHEPVTPADRHRLPATMAVPLLLLVVPTVFGGLLLLGPVVPGQVHLSPVTAVLAVLLALAGATGATLLAQRHGDPVAVLPHRARAALADGFRLDVVQDRLVVRPVQAVARVVTGADRDVVDAYVRAGAVAARGAGRGLRRVSTGVATGYLTWVVVGAVAAAVAGVSLR
ncbi:MAG TPA: NADH-quinone oxidoreductase subunit L [Actinomycetales bacterium]|nr:NADH-quinone oxidoreductase subunit L [Actinomycetales bacterium]